MEYNDAVQILNRHIFEGDRRVLIKKIADNPERYTGLFRPTKPRAKIIQNLLQSHEIRFGDAMEEMIKTLLQDIGYEILPERLQNDLGEYLTIDQYFTDGETYYFIEQKVRDDHDSTKKRGQIENFEKKLGILQEKHGDQLAGIMYFIDPDMHKNKTYYLSELSSFSAIYSVELHLLYGSQLSAYMKKPEYWEALLSWLTKWKEDLPDFPEINMDISPDESFEEVKDLAPRYWRKIIFNDDLWDQGIMHVISKDGITLKLIYKDFMDRQRAPYIALSDALKDRLMRYFPN